MRISDFVALAICSAIPALLLLQPGCLDSSTCLRNSDCPSVDICSVGACILAPDASDDDGAVDADTEAAPLADAAATSPIDAGTPDVGLADVTVGSDSGDASDDASDADQSGD